MDILDAFPASWHPIAAIFRSLGITEVILSDLLAAMRHAAVDAAVTGSSPLGMRVP